MKKLASIIVRFRYIIAIIFIAIVITCACLIPSVKLNYDFTKYLGEDSLTSKALRVMEEEFGSSGTAQVLIENIESDEATVLYEKIIAIDGVETVVFSANDPGSYNAETKCALYKIFLNDNSYSPQAHETIKVIRSELCDYSVSINGTTAESAFLQKAVSRDMTLILIISCVIILGILFLTSTSWIEPLIFMFVIFCAILINMGTNVIMGEISFITSSICAIMQLALAMDYSIILLHRFNECKLNQPSNSDAMKETLCKTFSPISSASLTTIAGLAALMFMQFTIGFDIGMVLAKGIVISILSIFLFMPCVILISAKLIDKTKHKSVFEKLTERIGRNREERRLEIETYNSSLPDGKKAKRFHSFANFQYNSRKIVPFILLALIIIGAVIQPLTSYSYTVKPAKSDTASISVENQKIIDAFGSQNPVVIILPKDTSTKTQKYIGEKVKSYSLKIDGENVNVFNYANGVALSGVLDELNIQQITELLSQNPAASSLPIETLITGIFEENNINQNGTMRLYDVLKYASETNYIAEKTKGLGFLTALIGISAQNTINDTYALCNEAIAMMESENYVRLILNLNLAISSDESFEAIDYLNSNIQKWYNESEEQDGNTKNNIYVLSESLNYLEVKNTFTKDLTKINLISFFAIFIIILLTFRSLSIPVLLTLTIQGAIWLTMSFFFMAGIKLYFIAYLVVLCIQMGATVDYAILMTSRYMEARKIMDKKSSMGYAMSKSLPTILTSGLILVIAAFLVGIISTISIISTLGLLLSLGCLISLLFIIFALPQTIMLCDKILIKTTLKSSQKEERIDEN